MPDPEPQSDVSASAPASDGAVAVDVSSQSEEHDNASLFDRIFRRDRAADRASDGTEGEHQPQSKPSEQGAKREYTDDEFARAVQAETDRRESKRQAEQRLSQKKELRKQDPYAYVEQEETEEQQHEAEERFTAFLGDIGRQYDGVLLDPVIERLPEDERTRLLADEKAGVGLEGRKSLMSAALDSLIKSAKAEGEAAAQEKLRKNPAFRKQLLSEFRGSDEHEEVDLIPGTPTNGTARNMNDFIRVSLGRSKYQPHE